VGQHTLAYRHCNRVPPRRLLDAFDNNQWKAYQLRDAVPLKPASSTDLPRFNQDPTAPAGEGYTIDPEDKDRAEHELKAFKVSPVKFNNAPWVRNHRDRNV
jgi:hypothetical protein